MNQFSIFSERYKKTYKQQHPEKKESKNEKINIFVKLTNLSRFKITLSYMEGINQEIIQISL